MKDANICYRILMVANHFYPSIGGMERQALRLANELIARGVEVEVLTPRYPRLEKSEVVGRVRINRFPIAHSPHCKGQYLSKIYYFLTLTWELWKRRNNYEIIHVHQALFAAPFCVIVGKILGKKIVIKVAGSGVAGNLSFLSNQVCEGRLLIRVMRSADAVISLSRETTEELLANDFRSQTIHEIPNGVDIREFGCREVVPMSQRTDRRFAAIYLGRVSQDQKRLDLLVRAWALLVAKQKDVVLRIVGDGPDLQMISLLISKLGIEQQVEMLGFRSDVNELLCRSDCFVLPSITEGMSNALLEAMCTGVCCLASRIGGNEDLIEHGKTGLLFDLNEGDLLEALCNVYENANLREELGLNARKKVMEKYRFEVITPRYSELYKLLLSGSPLRESPL